jgi:catechol 2,3-dioxygenase-like lactoylglutathione lyase family enzyme
MPEITGLLETALYVDDMARSVRFFREVMGLSAMLEGDKLTAFDAGNRGVLLVFRRGGSIVDLPNDGGVIPGHDGAGPLHMAFAIAADSYDAWRDHLRSAGVVERGEVRWKGGGRSFYFEDPDGHVLEVATPGLWPNY